MGTLEPSADGNLLNRGRAIAMVVALLFAAWQAVANGLNFHRYFSSSAQAANVTDEVVFSCMEDLFEAGVPAGTSVWIEEPDGMWQQRLAEFSVPWARLAAERDDAEAAVSLGQVVDVTEPNCFGLTVVVEQL